MGLTDLVPLLTGAAGGLVLSLLLNYAQYKGWLINPKRVVPREDFDVSMAIAERNTTAIEKMAGRRRG